MKLMIPGTLPALNEMINSSKRSKYEYVKLKDDAIIKIGWAIKQAKLKLPNKPHDYTITWYCPSKRKDKDNIMGGQKFIFDALQEHGIIQNDGWKQIGDVNHRFRIDKENPRVEIEIKEVGE